MTEEIQMCLADARENMDKAMEHLQTQLSKIRAGRANAAILNGITVEAYGAQTPLNQVSNINTPDAKTISIQAWDKALLPDIEKAIMQANIGLNPQNDGEFIRLYLPPLTEERRKELVKQVSGIAEDTRVSIRSIRKDANDFIKELEKDGLGEDMAKTAEGQVQGLTDEFTKKVDEYTDAKEKEIMTV